MTNEYYGIPTTPTDDFLAHYGVKGMKWGVRKAIERANDHALERHYKRAARKLRKLDWKANPKEQEKYAKIQNKIAKVGLKVGLAGLGATAGAHGVAHVLRKKERDAYNQFYHPGWDKEAIDRLKMFEAGKWDEYNNAHAKRVLEAHNYETARNNSIKYGNAAYHVSDVASRVAGIGLGLAAGSKASAANAKWRTTPAGHTKMKANRDAWKNEMREAFKGTKYQNLPSYMEVKNSGKKKKIKKKGHIRNG